MAQYEHFKVTIIVKWRTKDDKIQEIEIQFSFKLLDMASSIKPTLDILSFIALYNLYF